MAHSGSAPDEVAIEERRAEVWRLYCRGNSYREIGRLIGVHHATVGRDIEALLKRFRKENDNLVEREQRASLERVNVAIARLMPMVEGEDPELAIQALDRLDKLEKRRAALLGLDAPERRSIDMSHDVKADPQRAAALVRERFGSVGPSPESEAAKAVSNA